MPDPYALVNYEVHTRLIDVLEGRAADPKQQQMKQQFLAKVQCPPDAIILEVGCGTGVLSRALAESPKVKRVVGIDHSGVFITKAHELSRRRYDNLSLVIGDGHSLSFADDSFDAVVFYTTLCHMANVGTALSEAYRVLKKGGMLWIFDGDYTTPTVTTRPNDPLQLCVDAAMDAFVLNRSLFHNLTEIVHAVGFRCSIEKEFEYLAERARVGYMVTLVERGADCLRSSGHISEESSQLLKMEAQRRIAAGEFFGKITYKAIYAERPCGRGGN